MKQFFLLLLLSTVPALADGYLVRTNGQTQIGNGGGSGGATDGYIAVSNGTQVLFTGIGGKGNYLTVTNGTLILGAVTPNLLLTNLVAYWTLDEAITSGSRADSVDSHTATDHGSTAFTNGIIGKAIRSPNVSSWLTAADSSDFSGGVSFSVQFWLQSPSGPPDNTPVFAKWGTSTEWIFFYFQNVFKFEVQKLDDSGAIILTNALPTLNTWHHVCAGFDSTNQVIWLQYDGGTRTNKSYTTACKDTTEPISWLNYGEGTVTSYAGFVDETGYWKRVLSSAEVISLYNSGVGLAYPFE